MSRKIWIILGLIVVLTGAGGAWYLFGYNEDTDSQAAPAATGVIYEPLPTDHTFGNRNAKVTVIEYASPTCPVCANFMANDFPRLKANYIDKGKIFYVYRTFIRNPDDGSAEKLARCLPKNKYMAFMDLLYRNQSKWDYEFGVPSPDGVHAALLGLVATQGMSGADADRCLASPAEEDAINKVSFDGVAKYNVSGTPTFVINGQSESGFEDLFSRLDAALQEK